MPVTEVGNLTNVNRCSSEVFDQIVAGTHATETYDPNALYEVELDNPIIITTEEGDFTLGDGNDLKLRNPLPATVNDRYLHTNASTGALEWSEVAQGGVTSITAGSGLSGDTTTGDVTLSLSTSGVSAGTYSNVTVDTYGRVTAGTNVAITEISVDTTNWTYDSTNLYYTKNISFSGMTSTESPWIDVKLTGSKDNMITQLEQYSKILKIDTATDSLVLYASELLTSSITLSVKRG